MPSSRKSQKDISKRYEGNRNYFQHPSSLRVTRWILSAIALVVTGGIAIYYLQNARNSSLEWFNSPGPISQAHTRINTLTDSKDTTHGCKACHDPNLNLSPLNIQLADVNVKCQGCHTHMDFHQPNVVTEKVDNSCTACHQEHLGAGPMRAVANVSCEACHNNKENMEASAAKGCALLGNLTSGPEYDKKFNALFPVLTKPGLVTFIAPRPLNGYTTVFKSFAVGHPEFQIQADKLTDPDTLQFGHQQHFQRDIPKVKGPDGKLVALESNCAYCHQTDSNGGYMLSISFEKSCKVCHNLQVDPTLPGLSVPHPDHNDSTSVKNFLLTIQTQYEVYARTQLKMTAANDVANFIGKHIATLKSIFPVETSNQLVANVFYAGKDFVKEPGKPARRALFQGCALCHEVKQDPASGDPVVTPPVIPDRWMTRAVFRHADHLTQNNDKTPDPNQTIAEKSQHCETCHAVANSTKTADINLPTKDSCAQCHSPAGGVVSNCTTCHQYHNQEAPKDTNMTSVQLEKIHSFLHPQPVTPDNAMRDFILAKK
jgi:hypothetical protein